MYSGVGGQMDFIRGASLSEGGKAIIALPSITKKGESRIVHPSHQEWIEKTYYEMINGIGI